MKALVKWFDGIDIRLPFLSIKFKKPNKISDSTLTNATGLNKANNYERDDIDVIPFLHCTLREKLLSSLLTLVYRV